MIASLQTIISLEMQVHPLISSGIACFTARCQQLKPIAMKLSHGGSISVSTISFFECHMTLALGSPGVGAHHLKRSAQALPAFKQREQVATCLHGHCHGRYWNLLDSAPPKNRQNHKYGSGWREVSLELLRHGL